MRRKSDKLSWDDDGKTVEAPSTHSQQRIKAVKPRMSWGDDASTVARPADAKLPEDAFRPDLVETREAADAVEISEASEAVKVSEELEPIEVSEEPQPVDVTEEAQPFELRAKPQRADVGDVSAPTATEALGHISARAERCVQPQAAHYAWHRWILLALTIPVFYALSYTAVRVVQKLQQPPAGLTRTGSSASQVWGAVREVLRETVAQLPSTPAAAPAGDEAPGTRTSAP